MFRLALALLVLILGLPGAAAADQIRTASYEVTPELSAFVHYPRDVDRGSHPLVVLLHGWFAVCADRRPDASYEDLYKWPCKAGISQVPNNRGYDYLARSLAESGLVVVSISANHINGGVHGSDDFADRAALINEHLRLWQEAAAGRGPLAPQFSGFRADLKRVGVMGHSMGGRAAARHSADEYTEWPAGVEVKAVVALQPIISGGGGTSVISRVPFLTVIGGCDKVSNPLANDYFEHSAEHNVTPVHRLMVQGANHNFFNTQWSPSSGQVTAKDDAVPTRPGFCKALQAEEKQLGEGEQRDVGVMYLSAFFQRYLNDETRFDPLLSGEERPLAHVIAEVDRP